jgi:hypothetical protein
MTGFLAHRLILETFYRATKQRIQEVMPGCRERYAVGSRSHTKHEAEYSVGGVEISSTATSLNALQPHKNSCLPAKTKNSFLIKIRKYFPKKLTTKKVRFATEPIYVSFKEELEEDYDWFENDELLRRIETWGGEAEPLIQQKDYISSAEGRTGADAALEVKTNLVTSRNDVRRNRGALIKEAACRNSDIEAKKKEAAVLKERINLQTSENDKLRQERDVLIFQVAGLTPNIEVMKNEAPRDQGQINVVTSQSKQAKTRYRRAHRSRYRTHENGRCTTGSTDKPGYIAKRHVHAR